jgi:type I restriction enzyme, S subunit
MLHKSDYVASGVPLINPTNILDDGIVPDGNKHLSGEALKRLSNYVLKPGDVLVGRRGEIGRCAVIGPKEAGWVCGTGCFFIRPAPSLNSNFLAQLLRSPMYRSRLERASTGATMKNISNDTLATLEIEIPSLAEQKRIVAILDEASGGIASVKANAEKNLQNARAIFESHLDAVLGQLGDGWVEKPLSELCDIKHGYAFEGEFFSDGGEYVLLTPGNFYETGGYRDRGDKQKYYTGAIPHDYILRENDLLVAMTEQAKGLLGSSILVPESNKFLHNQRLGLVVKKPGIEWENQFLYHVFNTRRVRAAIQRTASGLKVRHTSPSKICAVRVTLPTSLSNQKAIISTLDGLTHESERLASIYRRKLAVLDALKKSVLHHAFAGELTGSKTAELIEAVA